MIIKKSLIPIEYWEYLVEHFIFPIFPCTWGKGTINPPWMLYSYVNIQFRRNRGGSPRFWTEKLSLVQKGRGGGGADFANHIIAHLPPPWIFRRSNGPDMNIHGCWKPLKRAKMGTKIRLLSFFVNIRYIPVLSKLTTQMVKVVNSNFWSVVLFTYLINWFFTSNNINYGSLL